MQLKAEQRNAMKCSGRSGRKPRDETRRVESGVHSEARHSRERAKQSVLNDHEALARECARELLQLEPRTKRIHAETSRAIPFHAIASCLRFHATTIHSASIHPTHRQTHYSSWQGKNFFAKYQLLLLRLLAIKRNAKATSDHTSAASLSRSSRLPTKRRTRALLDGGHD